VLDVASGEPALWRTAPKTGRAPLRFRTQSAAQVAAASGLNAGK
jgi:hypothetical protein